jgi:hypothetical protein
MRRKEMHPGTWPVGPNMLALLSEFIVTAKVFVKPGLRKVNFYRWAGWDPLNYRIDGLTKQYIVKRAQPTDVEVVLDQHLIEQGYRIVWETQ